MNVSFKILTRLCPLNRESVFLKSSSQTLTVRKPFEHTSTCQLLYLYVKSLKEPQVGVTIYQPFTEKVTLLRMYEKLFPKKSLFSLSKLAFLQAASWISAS